MLTHTHFLDFFYFAKYTQNYGKKLTHFIKPIILAMVFTLKSF